MTDTTDKPNAKPAPRRRGGRQTAKKDAALADKYHDAAQNALRADADNLPGNTDTKRRKPSKRPNKRVSPELLEEVIDRMCEGESLRQICKEDRMPTVGTVLRYAMLKKNADEDFVQRFAEAYEIAKQVRAEAWADELVQISDRTLPDKDQVAQSKLRIDTRKWLLGKLLKQYSEKHRHELTGEDGGAIKTENTVSFYLPSNGREVQDTNDEDGE